MFRSCVRAGPSFVKRRAEVTTTSGRFTKRPIQRNLSRKATSSRNGHPGAPPMASNAARRKKKAWSPKVVRLVSNRLNQAKTASSGLQTSKPSRKHPAATAGSASEARMSSGPSCGKRVSAWSTSTMGADVAATPAHDDCSTPLALGQPNPWRRLYHCNGAVATAAVGNDNLREIHGREHAQQRRDQTGLVERRNHDRNRHAAVTHARLLPAAVRSIRGGSPFPWRCAAEYPARHCPDRRAPHKSAAWLCPF